MREFLLASPLAAGLNTAAPQTATITASENGVVHLDRLLVGAGATNEQAGYNGYDLGLGLEVQGLLVNGSIELIRGRNNPSAPGSVFSPKRERPVIALGDWAFGTGDTLALLGEVQGVGVTGQMVIATPFSPRNKREGYIGALPAVRQTYAGSPNTAIAAGATVNVTITFDQDGVADLDSLIVRGMYANNAAGSNDYDQLSGAFVNQITLPSGDQLILGQGVFGVAASIFAGTRAGNWWSPGKEWVSAGSTIVFSINNFTPVNADFSVGCPFYPAAGKDIC